MFRLRKTPRPSDSDDNTGTSAGGSTLASGKGRPTPKRRESELARKQRMTPPKDRKEAAARQREARRRQRELARQALVSGDSRHLPARDRGPVRKFCRDYVDSRRSVAEFLLPVLIVVFVLGFFPSTAPITTLIFFVTILAVVFDSTVMAMRLRKTLRTRFPQESLKGATLYSVLRSSQFRRMRLPKPQVRVGKQV